MNYLELTFETSGWNQEKIDLLVAKLYGLGFDSFEQKKTILSGFIVDSNFDLDNLKDNLIDSFTSSILEVKKIKNENWNALWESSFDPIVVSNACCVRAPFHSLDKSYDFDVIISPKMSFGTGHHATTFLMLKKILSFTLNSKSILDVGSGTGVLSILSEKMGASKVMALDIDPNAYENSLENIRLNNCSHISVVCGDVFNIDDANFDFLFANINKNVLLKEIEVYTKFLKKEGLLVLSGFFDSDFDSINQQALASNLILKSQDSKNTWQCVVYRK